MSGPTNTLSKAFLISFLVLVTTSCTYWEYVDRQAELKEIQVANPTQHNLKHIVEVETFFVYGQVFDPERTDASGPIIVAAYSNQYLQNEIVDYMQVTHTGTHFGMNLPSGVYDLIALTDSNRNGIAEQSEIVGHRRIQLDSGEQKGRVVGGQNIHAGQNKDVARVISFPLALPEPEPVTDGLEESLFYPKGTIRALSDPLFDADMSTLGMYEPSAFLERASTMFFALEEDSLKIPVLFVHGIGGSARNFELMVDKLDRRYFQPWFFHYPSGSDLNQLATIFYDVFLSSKVIVRGKTPLVIVAHSMGGVVVREALNLYRGADDENRLQLLITLSSPFDGHTGAAMGEKYSPLVLPSWRDLNPNSDFIKQLYRRPLSPEIKHVLIYTQISRGKLITGVRGDGVVSVASQLRPDSGREATTLIGFASSHAGILKDTEAITQVTEQIHRVKNMYPPKHLEAILAGGFDIKLGDNYTAIEKHYIQTTGVYLSLLARGELDTLGEPALVHFVDVVQGKAKPGTATETAWLKLIKDYPDVHTWPLRQ